MTTAQTLKVHPEQYCEMYTNAYIRWCESVTINNTELQKVLANAAISKWYNIEFAKCEAEFHKIVRQYDLSPFSPSEIQEVYTDCTFKMFNIRPTALLTEAKKSPKGGIKIKQFNPNTLYHAN